MFADNRESGETKLRQCQLVMLRMLKIFDYLCARHNIEYFLIGGSLLGAVRHKGFIPWDDDLDVGMTRKNYEKFLEKVVMELPETIFFQTPETDPGYPACDYVDAKLRDKYSRYTKNKFSYHDGLQLDIFVYDKAFLPSNFFIILQNFILGIPKSNSLRYNALKLISKLPFNFVYTNNYMHKWGMMSLGKFFFYKHEISSLVRMKFEDMEVLVPNGWHDALTRQYNDYMQLPPEDKRVTHHIEQPEPCKPCEHAEILIWDKRLA